MKIITISREFGSGGREIGKRLAKALKIPCYDQQIIEMIAKQQNCSPEYVSRLSEKEIRTFYPSTIARGFSSLRYAATPAAQISEAEHDMIRQLAQQGNCVIIGRCADHILRDMRPLRLFVYADMPSKLARCRQRAETEEQLSDRRMQRQIKEIDKRRAAYRAMYTDTPWKKHENYDLCINTSGKEIKALIPGLASYTEFWYKGEQK